MEHMRDNPRRLEKAPSQSKGELEEPRGLRCLFRLMASLFPLQKHFRTSAEIFVRSERWAVDSLDLYFGAQNVRNAGTF